MDMRIVLKRNQEHVLQTKLAIKVIYGTIPYEAGWKKIYKKGKEGNKGPQIYSSDVIRIAQQTDAQSVFHLSLLCWYGGNKKYNTI